MAHCSMFMKLALIASLASVMSAWPLETSDAPFEKRAEKLALNKDFPDPTIEQVCQNLCL